MTTKSVTSAQTRTEAVTLVELLRRRALEQPDRRAYSFLPESEADGTISLTYGELDRRARAIAARLQAEGAADERVLLLYPPGLDYVAAFFGCLYAGAVAVPAYPPQQNRHLSRLQAIAADAGAKFVLTTSAVLGRFEGKLDHTPSLKALNWLNTDGIERGVEGDWREPRISGDSLAFLQYTSGSTGDPKGVMVSHRNLLHNSSLLAHGFEYTPETVCVSWLPLYHDMGLIGGVLQPLYGGFPALLMSPVSFLRNPYGWLKAISGNRATLSGAPNFAYDLCARKVTAEQRATLDLSSWEVAFTGAEPIRAETLERFAEVFGPCGFRREAFLPCYGLAEATLVVSSGTKSSTPVTLAVSRAELERGRVVTGSDVDNEELKVVVGCGRGLLDERLVVAEPESGRECAAGEVGEIWVSSRSVAGGYWGRPEETERTFGARLAGTGEGPFLRTGDLGYMRDGELFVTGRLKDLIILRGRNHYPQDIELTAERSHAGLRQNGGAAFSVEVGGEERLVVVQEVEPRGRVDVAAAIEDLRRAVAAEHEVQAYAVALVRAGEVPRTSSGKIQRRKCRAKFLERGLEIVGEWRASEGSVEAAESAAPEAFEEVEGWLAAQLASRLGVSAAEIDVRQPLARYGLDSLSAVELTYLIESRLGLLLPMADLLEGMSIADIVAEASKQQRPAAVPFETRDEDSHALTQGQEALWFIYQMAPDSPAYNIPAAMRVTSPLDAEALRRALRRLVERHPSLSATFDEVRGKVVQRNDLRAEVCPRVEDAADWSEAELSERLLEEARLPFDLRRGPALRVSLFRRGVDEHVLLVVVHHIVADFWSLALLTDELTKFYQAESEGREALPTPPAARYGDFVRWQEAMLSSEAGVRQREYWEKQLAGPLPVLNLATDRQRPPAQTFRGASLPFRIGAGLTDGLKSLGRRHDATLYTTLLAAFQTLLHRYTGQEDIIVGSPTAGRSRAEFAGVVGYFVNPLVMRADLSRNPTFAEFLGRVRRTVLESFRHQDYPFPLLVKKLQPERDPSRSPIFETAFVLQKAHAGLDSGLASFAVGEAGAALELNGLKLESLALDHGVAQFDLMLVVTEAGGELKASLQYNTDLFDAETVARMVGHFETLLGGIVADDTRRLAELGLLTAPEERRLLVELNDTARAYPSGCMHELFEAQAARTPDAVALVCGDERLTYRELNERANRLAHHLRALGVGPEEFVGILLERRVELIVALLATLKAGGAYVPLDPAYPLERLSFMLEDTRAGVLLTQRKLAHLLPQAEAKVVCVDEEANAFAAHDAENPRAVATPVSLGYVIYTSGSTGRPKGVSIEHHSAVTLIHWAKEVFTPAELSSVLASTSICFDLSIFEIFVPLSLGGRVVLAENALQLPELTSEVSLVNTVPSAMAELARGGGLPASVITVNLAGEPLKNMLVQQVYCHLKGGRVLNLYGPSEDTTYSTYTLAPANSDAEPTIGRPIANTQVYLLDAHLRPVPAGVVGELHLGGEGLARGYLRRPGLTSEKFIPDPFSTRPGSRLYGTGDLARYLPSGELEYLGRVDNQVKIRGFRIEIGEIESVLSRHEGVREAVVVAREDGPGDKRLVAYLTAANGTTPAVGELRRHILQTLPEYMIPSVFVPLAEMPLTANGKVNRRALPAPASTRADDAAARVAPRTHVEKGLADIWSQLLGLDAVGIHDNFFELGGHSLLATQLVSQVRETFQIELPLRGIFERPTVAELAALTEESARAAQGLQFPPITAAARGESGPLSFAQQRLWFLHQLESGSAFYNIPAAVRLTGALDAEALQRAFDELVRRHESLRTVIKEIDGEPRQVVCPVAPVALTRLDLSGMSETDRETAWRHLAEEEARRPFDLAAGPLLRVSLLKLAEDSHVLLLTMHHIISDGWSLGVMLRELSALLGSFAAGLPSPLPELTIQYGDFVDWQRRCMTSEVLEPQLSYWARQLADAPPVLELPTSRPRPSVQSTEGATRSASLSPALTASLKALSRQEGTTLFMTLLAAFNVLLGRYARQSDICVGSPVAGRHRGETEDLIGFFVNTLVLRTDLSGAPTFRELLGRVRETCLEAYAHQDVPFERLVEELQPERSLGHTPLFQVTFALQNALTGATELPGLEFAPLATETGSAKFDLSLEMSQEQGALTANVNYNTQLFDEAFIEHLMANFEVLLGGVVADPARPLGELPLLTDEETRRVLVDWNDNACDAPRLLAHELVESRAASHPEALAVVAPDGRLTYAELNERANSLAHFLRASGVGPESRVGLLMERGAELLVGLLGVLKAGGAYLPLDPAYPAARLGFMLEDSGASLLLTQERLADVLPPCGARRVCVDAQGEEIARFARTNPEPSAVAENLAYVIYTSGSTGRPKGVQIAHAALLNLIGWHQGSNALAPSDRMTHLAGISFDASVWEVWPALAAGASLYLPDEERRMFPARLVSWLVENGINITFLPTPLAERLMAEVWPESGVALRSVLTGGDRLNKRPHASLPFEVVNHYGPTENTVVTTAGRVASASGQETLPSIGRPVSNTRVYVLDAHGRPVPVGVIGELYVGGDSLARGYLNEARLTAEKFIPDPFGTRPGARLYRTGDLVRFLPDGRLDFVGRADSQVKIRGFRIELGEIEASLAAHTDVRECAVMAREGAGAEKWLAAYVVAAEGVTPRASDLRSHLLAELPEYMIPTAFVMLDELPLTPNGKVDHKALPEPEVSASEAGYKEPRTPVEELLCGLWAGLLKVGRVGVEDNFFELGGHSLLATQLVSQVRETFRIELPLRALFESPTVAGLARVVEERLRGGAAALPPVRTVERGGELPLSFAQERLWLIDQLEPDNAAAYNMPAAILMRGPLDIAALERTLTEVVRRHEALRTTVRTENGQPVQFVEPAFAVKLPLTDLRHVAADAREAEARRLAEEEARRPFDLSGGALMRAGLLRLAEEEHVLLFTMHHIVSDGWSVKVLVREVSSLYEAYARGEESPLSELSVQYADYAVWQREWLQGEALDAQLAYWKQQLEGIPPLLELPLDKPRPAVQTFEGGRATLLLPRELRDSLKHLGRGEGATLYMTLLAAFKVLLYRYTGQEDIVVGTPIAGRNRAELESLIGFFINSLALRTDLSGAPSFRELLGRVREVTLGAYAHQDVPFEKVLEELNPERSLNHTPVFQVYFNMLNMGSEELELAGLQAEHFTTPDLGAKFDLTLYVEEQEASLTLRLAYNKSLFAHDRMVELLGQFEQLLAQAAASPDSEITRLSLVTPAARAVLPDPTEMLSAKWEGTAHGLFAEHARRAPERVALRDKDASWSYGELDARSGQLAQHLRANGIGGGDVVAVYAHRSASLVWALMGILKSGAAFAVLDPAYPAARLIDCLDVSGACGIIEIEAAGPLHEELEAYVNASAYRCRVRLPRRTEAAQADLFGEYSCEAPSAELGPDSLAYIAFTSGTTGKPKGILGRHGSLTHFLPWFVERFALDGADTFSMLSGLSHDPLHRDVFIPLMLGGCVSVPDPEMIGRPRWLGEWMRRERVTVANLTPAMGQLLAEQAEEDGVATVDELRLVFFVGDVLTKRDVAMLKRLSPFVSVVNFYGSTETQRAVSHYVLPCDAREATAADASPRPLEKEVIPLGRGIRDVQLIVLNAAGQQAGMGEAGEIYLRSPHIALGYRGAAELTAERFVVNPFTGGRDDRLYKTGDLGRYLPDGNVEPLGRADFQVKIRGFRVELGEVESVLGQHAAVAECVALAREDVPGDKRLVAYVVAEGSVTVAPSELRGFLKQRLPEYMLPSAFVFVEAMPLTPNGKLDRRALPAPTPEATEAGESHGVSMTPVEEMLAAVWAEVLGVREARVGDNFFELGGHSLLATRVLSRLREAFHVEMSLRTFFESRTLKELAGAVEAAMRDESELLMPSVRTVARDGELPLSFAQQRLWFIDRLEVSSASYNIPTALRLRGRLDISVLERVLTEICRRHEALRTRFVEAGGEPRQVIEPASQVELPVTDLSHLDEQEREAEAARLAGEEATEPFDLSRGPLLRAQLLKLAEEEHVALLTMHHIVSDGWSMGVLVREVAALYEAYSRGEESPLEELPIQYADYAIWQREWLTGEVLERQLSYWRQQLGGELPVVELPTDRPRPAVQSYCGAHESFVLPEGLGERLNELSKQEGVTLYMTMLAAFQLLISRYTGLKDVAVGSPIAGRTNVETEGLIGFFANTLVMRTDLSGDPSFRELLKRVREVSLGAYAHQLVPFEKIVEELEPERSMSHSPLFQVAFALQSAAQEMCDIPGLSIENVGSDSEASKFDLTLALVKEGEGLRGSVEYKTDLFDADTIRRFVGNYQVLLEGTIANPDQSISRIPLLTARERSVALGVGDAPATRFAPEGCIHELFETQTARRPDSVALVFEDERLTYAQVNARANQIARHLRHLGVRPGALVGVCLERSADMVVALLGVLKAGAAYLPLDPAYPAQRLSFMLADAQAPVLLTKRALVDTLPAHDATVVCLDNDRDAISLHDTENLEGGATFDAPAYVIYTSGSTGKPKGGVVTHHNVVRLLRATEHWFNFDERDVWTLFHSYAFDFSVWEIWGALLYGGRLVVVPHWDSRSPEAFHELLRAERVTVLNQTPSAFYQLIRADEAAADSGRELSLRYVIFGGEALELNNLIPWFGRHGDTSPQLVNMYGITETTVHVTYRPISLSDMGRIQGSPIGVPMSDLQAYLLDERLEPVPVGVPAELFIGGAGLASGYLRRPSLTATRFIPDPFSEEHGSRLYRTGDLARRLPSGELEYLGRIDQQVKVRGFRIELGEIEAVLSQHRAVRECAVAVRPGPDGSPRLVAYLGVGDAHPPAAELREFAAGALPDYMRPAAYVLLDSLPLTRNGKVDKKALPDPADTEGEGEEQSRPATPVEELLCGVWAGLLKVGRVRPTDNFFELGGHSLLATQLVSRVREACGVELPLRALFESPTVEGMAAQVEARLRGEEGSVPPPVVRAARGESYPLSFAQQRLWFIDRLEGGSPFYNIPTALRLRGRLDVAVLERVLTEICRRHESLRTRFVEVSGEARQIVEPASRVELPVTDLSGLAEQEREAEAARLAGEEARLPFDLSRGPLLRAQLLRLTDEEHIALLTIHHIISDGWSMGVLVKEVAALYEAYSEGRESPLGELPIQYADYAVWQRQRLQGEVLEQQLSYWRQQLGGELPVIELPTDKPRSAVRPFGGAVYTAAMDASIADSLRELSRQEGVTLYMTMLAAFQLLLSRYTGLEDVPVGTAVANRTRGETESLIGFFVNTLVMRGDLTGDPSFRELLRRTREVCLGAYAHQETPFERLVEELQPERAAGRTPLVQVAFGVQNTAKEELTLKGLTLSGLGGETEAGRFELTVWVSEREDGGLGVRWCYDPGLYGRERVERMQRHFGRLLEGAGAEPDARLSSIEMLTEEERERRQTKQRAQAAASYEKFKRLRPQAAGAGVAPPRPTPAPLGRGAE